MTLSISRCGMQEFHPSITFVPRHSHRFLQKLGDLFETGSQVNVMLGETAFRIKILCVISRVFRELRAKKGSLVAGLFSGQEANLLAFESDNQERKEIEGKNGKKGREKVWVISRRFCRTKNGTGKTVNYRTFNKLYRIFKSMQLVCFKT